MQAFPAAISAEEADPFLMCDHFGPTVSEGNFENKKFWILFIKSSTVILSLGIETDPDKFPVGWHPHRGMDILTYMVEGFTSLKSIFLCYFSNKKRHNEIL